MSEPTIRIPEQPTSQPSEGDTPPKSEIENKPNPKPKAKPKAKSDFKQYVTRKPRNAVAIVCNGSAIRHYKVLSDLRVVYRFNKEDAKRFETDYLFRNQIIIPYVEK